MMKTLVVNTDGSLSIQETAIPVCGDKQALVKMIACGICGSDTKLIHHSFKGFPSSMYPLMLGHEGVGEVVEVGADVKGLKLGDKVLLPFVEANDDFNSGWGAFSEYGIVHDPLAYEDGEAPGFSLAQTVLSKEIDPVDGVMLITLREVLGAIRYFGILPEDSVVVYGCGPVGVTFIKLLSLLGCKDIIAVARTDEKLQVAAENGAAKLINNSTMDVVSEVRAIYPEGVKYVIDAIGLPTVVNQGMALLADRGAVLCYGVPEQEEITIDFSKASYNWRVIYQQMPEKKEEGEAHAQIMTWIRSGEINLKDYISDYFSFEDSVEAFEKVFNREVKKKGIITF